MIPGGRSDTDLNDDQKKNLKDKFFCGSEQLAEDAL